MKFKLLILLLLGFLSIKSQTISRKDTLRIYELSVSKFPQDLRLIEFCNNTYKGTIYTEFNKGRYLSNTFFNRLWRNVWNIGPSEDIIDSAEISPELTQKLMTKLELEGIETIINCNDDTDCSMIKYLDGSTVEFKISTPSLQRVYGFQEIHPYTINNLEKNAVRSQAQRLVSTVYDAIDFEYHFKKSVERLPRGYYFYSGSGYSFLEFYNRKKIKRN
jgi:hypothetical protein